MPYFAFQCEDGHGSVKLLPFNKSQMVETSKTGTYRVMEALPWIPREEVCEICGKPAKELTALEAAQAGHIRAGSASVRFNWLADD
jgi:hypothetical protein